MIYLWAAFLWGFAEATLFFIVPDILLTFLALLDLKMALWGCLFSLVGALLGGGIMYRRGTEKALLRLPGIGRNLILRERKRLLEQGGLAIFLGPLKGVPYKIYAVLSPSCGISFTKFMVISVPARIIRFLVAVLAAFGISRGFLSDVSMAGQMGILLGFWVLFYSWYFWKFQEG